MPNTAIVINMDNEPFKRFVNSNARWSQKTKDTVVSDMKALIRDFGFMDDPMKCFLLKFYIDNVKEKESKERQAQGFRHITGSRAAYQMAIQAYITFLRYQEMMDTAPKSITR
jgi:hypothetical protein